MSMLMLRTEDLAKTFTLHLRDGLRMPVLSGIGLAVHAGECVVLSGPSGAGKSTLLRSLYGNYRAESGRILVRHGGAMIDLAAADPRTVLAIRRDTLGYVSQFLRVVPRVPALDVVADALAAPAAGAQGTGGNGATPGAGAGYEAARADARATAAAMLLRLNIAQRLHAIPPATFSGGEQQRVNLARGFIRRHPVLLLDEPTASLDAANRAVVIEMVREAKADGIAIVAICHDTEVRDAIADRLFPVTPLQDAA